MRLCGGLALTALLTIAGCEKTRGVATEPLDLPGTSRAAHSALLARDVLNGIVTVDKAKDPTCDSHALTDTRVVEDAEAGISGESKALVIQYLLTLRGEKAEDVKEAWIESWTIDRCGSSVVYMVMFLTTANADGTYFSVLTMAPNG